MTLSILEPARELLLRRIEQYSDATCASLLEVIDGLATLHGRVDDAGRAWIDAAAAPLVEAARQVTFDVSREKGPLLPVDFGPVPARPASPTLPILVEPRAALGRTSGDTASRTLRVLDALESLQADLIFASDVQESVDALANARCYRRAAAQIALAARPLAALGTGLAG